MCRPILRCNGERNNCKRQVSDGHWAPHTNIDVHILFLLCFGRNPSRHSDRFFSAICSQVKFNKLRAAINEIISNVNGVIAVCVCVYNASGNSSQQVDDDGNGDAKSEDDIQFNIWIDPMWTSMRTIDGFRFALVFFVTSFQWLVYYCLRGLFNDAIISVNSSWTCRHDIQAHSYRRSVWTLNKEAFTVCAECTKPVKTRLRMKQKIN